MGAGPQTADKWIMDTTLRPTTSGGFAGRTTARRVAAARRSLSDAQGCLPGIQECNHLAVLTAAGMYAGVALFSLIESLIPGKSQMPIASSFIDLAVAVLVLLFGRRTPRPALVVLGPLGVALVGYALAHAQGFGDCAVMYVWPMLWTAHFFGRRATAFVIAATGVVDALALNSALAGGGDTSRWIEVMVSMTAVAVVVRALTENNERLFLGLASEARTDPLTGLLNRRGLNERAEVELARARRDELPVSVIAFDIDHFKLINDQHGHDAGDRVLKLLGSMLSEQVRGSDIAARVGGEEFLVVLPGCDEQQATAAAERARLKMARVAIADVPNVTLSAGVATANEPAELEALTGQADCALYRAKQQGRNRTVLASQEGSVQPSNRFSPLVRSNNCSRAQSSQSLA